MCSFARLGAILFLWMLHCVVWAGADEDKLKAEFLIRFAGFTTWTVASFEGDLSPVVIGVWQDGAFTKTLASAVGTRTVGSRKIVVRTVRGLPEIRFVNVLYIPASEARSVERILAEAVQFPILTVSETSGFCRRGGMLNFYQDGEYIRFEANPDAVRRSGLQISSQLLRLARIVRG